MIGRILREPLLHFFVIGSVLFAVYAWTDDGPGGDEASLDEIVVDGPRIASLDAQFRRLWQRPPSQAELKALVDSWVREEILYREGLAMGLDRDDSIIRKRVAQKLSFVSEDIMTVEPSEAELSQWFSEHRDDYRQEMMLTFQQILVDNGTDEARARSAAAEARDAIAAGFEPAELGIATLLPGELPAARHGTIVQSFGEGFASELLAVPLGEWRGPVSSEYGAHLVRVTARDPGRLLELSEVRSQVERDLVRARLDEANQAFLDQLRSRYRIRFEVELADRPAISSPAGFRN